MKQLPIKAITWTALVAATVAVVSLFWPRSDPATGHSLRLRSSAGATSNPLSGKGPSTPRVHLTQQAHSTKEWLLTPASTRSYVVRYATSVVTEQGLTLGSFTLTGELELMSLSAHSGWMLGAKFRGELSDAAGVEPGSQSLQALNDAVAQPFFLQFTTDGRFHRALGQRDLPRFVARMWQAMGEYFQAVRVDGESSWQTTEKDASGTYRTEYEANPDFLLKRKLHYESLSSTNLKTYEVNGFEARFRFDVNGDWAGLALTESIAASTSDGLVGAFESNTELALDELGPVLKASATPWESPRRAAVELGAVSNERAAAAFDESRIGGLNFSEALARVSDLGAKDDDRRKRAQRAFVALAALLRQDPSKLELVRELLENDGPLTHALLAALRDAATPHSQALLAEMAAPSSPLSGEGRLEAARSLSHVPTPTEDTVTALHALQSDPAVGVQATYGLGSALYRLQDQDREFAERARQVLATELAEATTPERQAAVLTALGNAGSAAMLETIRAYVASPSFKVRAAAAQALRRIPGAAADDLLAQLSRDTVDDVRWSAVDAIRERSLSGILVQALVERALTETQFSTRARALTVLSSWLASDPTIAPTLRLVAERDPSQDLRDIAKRALAKHG